MVHQNRVVAAVRALDHDEMVDNAPPHYPHPTTPGHHPLGLCCQFRVLPPSTCPPSTLQPPIRQTIRQPIFYQSSQQSTCLSLTTSHLSFKATLRPSNHTFACPSSNHPSHGCHPPSTRATPSPAGLPRPSLAVARPCLGGPCPATGGL